MTAYDVIKVYFLVATFVFGWYTGSGYRPGIPKSEILIHLTCSVLWPVDCAIGIWNACRKK